MHKHIGRAAVASVLAAGTAFGTFAMTGAAQAAPASVTVGFIDGKGVTTNDWGDESLKFNSKSNAVRLWQWVLYADGARYTDEDGDLQTFEKSDIKGKFNAITESATEDWQATNELDDITGRADKATFSVADDNLSSKKLTTSEVRYRGSDHNVTFRRVTVLGGNEFYQVQVGNAFQFAKY